MSKTIEGIKDEVAIEYGWKSWKSCYGDDGITNVMIDEVAQRYAQSQTKELQEQNAEFVEMLEELLKELRFHGFNYSTAICKAESLIAKNKQS